MKKKREDYISRVNRQWMPRLNNWPPTQVEQEDKGERESRRRYGIRIPTRELADAELYVMLMVIAHDAAMSFAWIVREIKARIPELDEELKRQKLNRKRRSKK